MFGRSAQLTSAQPTVRQGDSDAIPALHPGLRDNHTKNSSYAKRNLNENVPTPKLIS